MLPNVIYTAFYINSNHFRFTLKGFLPINFKYNLMLQLNHKFNLIKYKK